MTELNCDTSTESSHSTAQSALSTTPPLWAPRRLFFKFCSRLLVVSSSSGLHPPPSMDSFLAPPRNGSPEYGLLLGFKFWVYRRSPPHVPILGASWTPLRVLGFHRLCAPLLVDDSSKYGLLLYGLLLWLWAPRVVELLLQLVRAPRGLLLKCWGYRGLLLFKFWAADPSRADRMFTTEYLANE